MNRRVFLKSANLAGLAIALPSAAFAAEEKKALSANASSDPRAILLKD